MANERLITEGQIDDWLSLGEIRPVEFKASGSRKKKEFFRDVIKAIAAMANLRDGGTILLGVEQQGKKGVATGCSENDVKTWSHDDVSASLAKYLDPSPQFLIQEVAFRGVNLIAITVREFDTVPIVVRTNYDTLCAGDLYFRSSSRVESASIKTYDDMRQLIDLATEKAVVRFERLKELERTVVSGTRVVPSVSAGAAEFDRQFEELFK